jgi:hypothetical protein
VVVYTKPELRSFDAIVSAPAGLAPDGPADEGEEEQEPGGGGGESRQRRRRAPAAGGSSGARKRPSRGPGGGGGRGGRATFKDLQQRTMDEFVTRM